MLYKGKLMQIKKSRLEIQSGKNPVSPLAEELVKCEELVFYRHVAPKRLTVFQ